MGEAVGTSQEFRLQEAANLDWFIPTGGHGVASERNILSGWVNLCIEDQIVNFSGFTDHMVPSLGAGKQP